MPKPAVARSMPRHALGIGLVCLFAGLGLAASSAAGFRASAPVVLIGAASSGATSTFGSLPKTFRLGAPPIAVAISHDSVWVVVETKLCDAQLWQLDAQTGRRLSAVAIGRAGPDIGAVAVSGTGVWAAAGDHIVYVDPSQRDRVRRVRVSGTISGLTVGFGSVWMTTISSQRNLLIRVDPKTLSIRARIRTAGADAVESALGSVRVAGGGSLARVNPGSDQLTNVLPLASPAADLATSPRRLWLLENGSALALDQIGHVRRHLALPFAAARIAVSNERLWAIDNCGCAIGQLAAMDLRTGRPLTRWAVGATPVAVAADGDQVWVASFGNSTLLRVRM